MRIYIAGSITNNLNYEKEFKEVGEKLTKAGHVVLNPVKNVGFDYQSYIDMGLAELSQCDAIYLLEGWEKSEGASLERLYAKTVRMKIYYEGYGNEGLFN